MGKTFSPGILLRIDGHRPQSDLSAVTVEHPPAFIFQNDFCRIQRLSAISVRPPFPGIWHADAVPGISRKQVSLRIIQRRFQYEPLRFIRKRFYRHIENYRYLIAAVAVIVSPVLRYVNLFQPGFHAFQQRYFPENSGIWQPRPPVPAKHAMCLPQMGKPFHALGSAAGIDFLVFRGNISCRGIQPHKKLVLPRPRFLQHIKFPNAVHIVCMSDTNVI